MRMAKKRSSPVFVVVPAFLLDCVDDKKVLDLEAVESEEECRGPLSDLETYPADDLLASLRKAFTLTFPHNPFIDGIQNALTEIKRVCIDGIKSLPEVLETLDLKPMPFVIDDPLEGKAMLFKHVFVESKHLRIQVKYEGKRQSLFKLVDAPHGDEVIRAIRQIVTDTFTEAHDEDQHGDILMTIRHRIWNVLPQFNDLPDECEVERIAPIPDYDDED